MNYGRTIVRDPFTLIQKSWFEPVELKKLWLGLGSVPIVRLTGQEDYRSFYYGEVKDLLTEISLAMHQFIRV